MTRGGSEVAQDLPGKSAKGPRHPEVEECLGMVASRAQKAWPVPRVPRGTLPHLRSLITQLWQEDWANEEGRAAMPGGPCTTTGRAFPLER